MRIENKKVAGSFMLPAAFFEIICLIYLTVI